MFLFQKPHCDQHAQLGTNLATTDNCKGALDTFEEEFSIFESAFLGFTNSVDNSSINAQMVIKGRQATVMEKTNSRDNKLSIAKNGSSTNILIVKHKSREQKQWGPTEDQKLYNLFYKLDGRWKEIAQKMKGRNASQCSQRWRRLNTVRQPTPNWSTEQDQLLINLVSKHGRQWKKIVVELDDKTEKQVMNRFNKLNNKIKTTAWTAEEDQLILDQYYQFGSKWTQISKLLTGRPANAVKNRFYGHIRSVYLAQPNPYFVVTEM